VTHNPITRTRPTDHLRRALPSNAVLLAPAPPDAVPMRPPAGAWGLVVVAVRTTDLTTAPVRDVGDAPAPDRARTDIADLVAGVWLSAAPPAHRHDGDVVVRLHAPADTDDPAVADVEVLAAAHGVWNRVDTWRSVGVRWPHEIALSVLVHMRYLADAALNDAHWAVLTGPIAAALPDKMLHDLIGEFRGLSPAPPRRRAPDALAALIEAGLVEVGEQLVFDGHTATIRDSGVLHDGGPHAFAVSTVTALATSLTDTTVNGWHLWRRARDHRSLAELRTELGTR
jgi:hypothetical protein